MMTAQPDEPEAFDPNTSEDAAQPGKGISFNVNDIFDDNRINDADADTALDIAIAAERIITAAQAVQARALAHLAHLRPSDNPQRGADEYAADEIAAALHLSRPVALDRLAFAHAITTRLPQAGAALRAGQLNGAQARALVELTDPLTVEQAHAVAARVLPTAGQQTVSQFRTGVRRAVLRIDPDGATHRHAHHRRHRHLALLQDGPTGAAAPPPPAATPTPTTHTGQTSRSYPTNRPARNWLPARVPAADY